MSYLFENKEWIFSGIGVFALGGAFALFKMFINKRKPKQVTYDIDEKLKNFTKATQESTEKMYQSLEKLQALRVGTEQPNFNNKNKVPSNITLKEIISDIHDAPPFQTRDKEKQYNGIYVEWSGKLWNVVTNHFANKDENVVKVEINPYHDDILYRIIFDANINDYPELKVLKKNSEIKVKGNITSASGEGLYVKIHIEEITFI